MHPYITGELARAHRAELMRDAERHRILRRTRAGRRRPTTDRH